MQHASDRQGNNSEKLEDTWRNGLRALQAMRCWREAVQISQRKGTLRRRPAITRVAVHGQLRVWRCMSGADPQCHMREEAGRLVSSGHVCTGSRVLAGRRRWGDACKEDDEDSWAMTEERDGGWEATTGFV